MERREPRPFRFGLQLGVDDSLADWLRMARRAEELGYDTVAVGDHLSGNVFAYGPALGALAAATTTLRLGTLVLVNDYRHPVVVAKEAATLDLLSSGRFELGLGAGWMAPDYASAGIPFDPPKVRVDRLIESVGLIRALLDGETVARGGPHYPVADLMGHPTPHQGRHVPLLIGAAGPRMVALAARRADVVSLLPRILPGGIPVWSDLTAEGLDEKVAWLHRAAPTEAERPDVHLLVQTVALTADWRPIAERLAGRWGCAPEEVRDSPVALIGTEDEVVALLHQHRARFGLAYISVRADAMEGFAPVIARLAGL